MTDKNKKKEILARVREGVRFRALMKNTHFFRLSEINLS